MSKIPVVKQDDCISCGLCVEICPEVFRLNDKDLSEVYNPKGASEAKIQEGFRKAFGRDAKVLGVEKSAVPFLCAAAPPPYPRPNRSAICRP